MINKAAEKVVILIKIYIGTNLQLKMKVFLNERQYETILKRKQKSIRK